MKVTLVTPSLPRSAFNNILSNLGYVMLGLLFLLIVLKRDIVHNRAMERNDPNSLVRARKDLPQAAGSLRYILQLIFIVYFEQLIKKRTQLKKTDKSKFQSERVNRRLASKYSYVDTYAVDLL